MVEATFLNPDLADNERWEHGFLLRGNPANDFHMIYIRAEGSWRHQYRLGKGEPSATLRQEVFAGIDKTPGGKNRLRLVLTGDQGWLFINNQPQGQLDLSAVEFDWASLVLNTEVEGAVTNFENFTVWKWHPSLQALPKETPHSTAAGTTTPDLPYVPVYGPASGTIIHEIQRPTNSFEIFSGPQIEGDLMVEATFNNPDSSESVDWNYGFLLRNPGGNQYHWIYLTPSRWVHKWRANEDNYTHDIRDNRSFHIDGTAGGKNTVRLVIIGDSVNIFINGEYEATSNLIGITDVAPVKLVVNDEWEGSTHFEGFTVWKWHPSLQELPE